MKQFLRRLFSSLRKNGCKQHLLDIGSILPLPADVLRTMEQVDFERSEAAFLMAIHGKHGCTVDWSAKADDIREALVECMTPDEFACLQAVHIPEKQTASHLVKRLAAELDALLPERSLVALESFGDFVILLLVRKSEKDRLKKLANGWLIG
jgi:hypothetical protein